MKWMHRTKATWLALLTLTAAACGGPAFDPSPLLGSWEGEWRDAISRRRGPVELGISRDGDELVFELRVLGGALAGLTPPTERFRATLDAGGATVAPTRSASFGEVRGKVDADGDLLLEFEGVMGRMHRLESSGSWSSDVIEVGVVISYDDGLTRSHAAARLERR
jgi:hypothetical protein